MTILWRSVWMVLMVGEVLVGVVLVLGLLPGGIQGLLAEEAQAAEESIHQK
jgi:hypothetical protein